MLPPHALISIANAGPAVLILGTKRQEVAGEFHRTEQVHLAYQWAASAIEQGDNKPEQATALAWLVLEPTNPHDQNAVAIVIAGHHVGYLPREAALHWAPIVSELERRAQAHVCCVAHFERPDSAGVREVWLMLSTSLNRPPSGRRG